MKNKQILLSLLLLFASAFVHAIGGYIYARTMIKSQDGNPYWVEYDDKGQPVSGLQEAADDLALDKVILVSGLQYRNDLATWDKLKKDVEDYNKSLPEGATERGLPRMLSRTQLRDKQISFFLLGTDPENPLAHGEAITGISEDLLSRDSAFLVIKAPSVENGNAWQYPTNDPEQLILAQMAFDPSSSSVSAASDNLKSFLFSRDTGELIRQSEHTIGFYSAFLYGENNARDEINDAIMRNKFKWNRETDEVPGAISGATVFSMTRYAQTIASQSHVKGDYSIDAGIGPPCNIMEGMHNYVTALLYTSAFNPRLTTSLTPYYLQRSWYMPCSGWFTFGLGTNLLEQMVNVNVEAINATLAIPIMQVDFQVDMLGVAGKAEVKNQVVSNHVDLNGDQSEKEGVKLQGLNEDAKNVAIVGKDGETRYVLTQELKTALEKRDNEDEKRTRELQPKFDLDGDGTDDTVKRGRVVCIQRKGSAANTQIGEDPKAIIAGPVVPNTDNRCQTGYEKGFQTLELDEIADKDLQQGVYFAGADTATGNCAIGTNTCAYPSAVKLLDDLMVNADQGLLKQLSLKDLRNTDVYVFRESTGELIAERTGLKEDEYKENCEDSYSTTGACNNFKDGNPRFFYRMEMRGMTELGSRPMALFSQNEETFKRWQVKSGMNPAFYQKEANHLRPGEPIKVIAINRASGYIGSTRTVINSNGLNMAMALPDMTMGPPNLKVWAKHTYKVKEGATKDEIRQYLIGNEGGAKADDMTVEVYTEWLDQDGSPLPAGLKDFGYTGRIARISGANVLQAATSSSEAIDSLAHFPIKPGRNLQVVKVEGGGSQHLYVQVNGEPMTRLVDFGTPEGEIELNQRVGDHKPDFTELGAGEQLLQYRPKHYVPILTPIFNENDTLAAKQLAQQNTEVTASSVDGVYQWRYRPEYQVSVYDLMVKEINKYSLDEQGLPGNPTNIIHVQNPQISSADDLIEFVFDLKDFVAKPLDMFSTKMKELVIGFGEDEIRVSIDNNGSVFFDNIERLANIKTEDFMLMRLYQNNDTANVLWEYAFLYAALATDNNHDGNVSFSKSASSAQQQASSTPPLSLIASAYAQQSEASIPNDNTSAENPFRFWVNDDYDVPNDKGNVIGNMARCPLGTDSGDQATCEQWDETDGSRSNTEAAFLYQIESERDLEDFAPLALKMSLPQDAQGNMTIPEYTSITLTAHGIGINLFLGEWEKGTDYLTDINITKKQTANMGKSLHLMNLRKGEAKAVSAELLKKMFKPYKNTANLIFEGTEGNAECIDDPNSCYIEIKVVHDGREVQQENGRLYLTILDVKHYYHHASVGDGIDGELHSPADKHQQHNYVPLFNPDSDRKAQEHKDDHIVFVHGWRMKHAERISFGETAFKRLYWSGYKGQFDLFSWPTGWFDKPAHVYDMDLLRDYLSDNEQNYGDSEVTARQAGLLLKNHLASLGGSERIHVFAHSMGNVVVSEALRNANGVPLVAHYIASQAAEVASAYNPMLPFIQHRFFVADNIPGSQLACGDVDGILEMEEAWRCYDSLDGGNSGFDTTPYDMPPNHYSFAIPLLHGPTTPSYERATAVSEGWGSSYYANIAASASGGVINFYNPGDIALEGWEFNQLTKPDLLGGPHWTYHYTWPCSTPDPGGSGECLTRPQISRGDKVGDQYFIEGSLLTWNNQIPIDPTSASILGHIIPARTKALGQVDAGGVIGSSVPYTEFGRSNQGHSSQFYKTYAQRQGYWDEILYQYGLKKRVAQ